MGRSIYFTDLEIEKLIDYVSNSVPRHQRSILKSFWMPFQKQMK